MREETRHGVADGGAGEVRRGGALFGRLLLEGTQRLRGSRALELLRELEPAPHLPRERVLAEQFSLLSKLLAHAETRVPYYRELFRTLGATARDIRSLADFARLPVLTKEIIRERGRDLVREDVELESLERHHSGGSTGVPLNFYRERAYMDYSDAGTFRNLRQSGWRPGEMIAFFWGGSERLYRMSRVEFELRQRARRMYQFDPFRSGPEEMERWLARWPSLNATVAYGYASTLARFAEFIESKGRTVAPLRGVYTTAEKLYPQQRAVLARVFSCRVFDCYGSSEVQNIAAECPAGRMHVNADFVIVETDDASPRAKDAPAPFLLTSLRNYAMPFIRYRNEDCGELDDGACDCGSNFPLMRLNVARTSDNFVLPGGRVVHGEFFTHLMYGSQGVRNFQFHQTARDAITLLVVPDDGKDEERRRVLRAAVEQVEALAPGVVRLEVREVESIPLSSAGKHRFVRSDVSGSAHPIQASPANSEASSSEVS